MTRSVSKKFPFVDPYLIEKVRKAKASGKRGIITTYSRRSVIIPLFVGTTIGVYNGKKFIPVKVTESLVGYKLGEFSPTKTFYGHGADKKVKR